MENKKMVTDIYGYLKLSLILSMLGAYLGTQISGYLTGINFILLIVLTLGSLIGLVFLSKKEGINKLLYYGFSFLSGLMMSPLINKAISIDPNLILYAIMITVSIFIGVTEYVKRSERDFSGMGKYLFAAIIVLILASILNIFINVPMMHIVLASFSAILFSLYLIYDTHNILKNGCTDPLLGAINLYLDILNIFSSILEILIYSSED